MADENPRTTWAAIVAEADRDPDGPHAAEVRAVMRHAVHATAGYPTAVAVIRDPRPAAELVDAFLREWRHRNTSAA